MTDKASIRKVKSHIEKEDGKLHVLVNKYVKAFEPNPCTQRFASAGQVGPGSWFLQDPSGPQHKSAETLGMAVFEGVEIRMGWASTVVLMRCRAMACCVIKMY